MKKTSKHHYEVILYSSNEDQAYIADVPELPGCPADGSSYQEATANVEVMIDEWIETAEELGGASISSIADLGPTLRPQPRARGERRRRTWSPPLRGPGERGRLGKPRLSSRNGVIARHSASPRACARPSALHTAVCKLEPGTPRRMGPAHEPIASTG